MSADRARVAAHIGVLNEAAMIGPCIEHLRRIGVVEFVVFDMNSTDGTREILAGMEGDELRVVEYPEDGTDKMLMDSAQKAIAESPADWCLMLDADEFPLPKGGNIAGILGRSRADLIELPRYNVVLGQEGLSMALPPSAPRDYRGIDMFVDGTGATRSQIEADPTLSWLRFVPAPKLAVRAGKVSRLVRGVHNAHPLPGETQRRMRSRNVVIAHAALTEYPRFQNKIASIRHTLDTFGGEMSKNFGWHWRRWLAQDEAGTLRDEFDRSFLSDEALDDLRNQGAVKSVADYFADIAQPPPATPEPQQPEAERP